MMPPNFPLQHSASAVKKVLGFFVGCVFVLTAVFHVHEYSTNPAYEPPYVKFANLKISDFTASIAAGLNPRAAIQGATNLKAEASHKKWSSADPTTAEDPTEQ